MLNPRFDATLALALVLLTSAACLPVEHDRRSQVFDEARPAPLPPPGEGRLLVSPPAAPHAPAR
ncbi:MAG: hypothetical protein P1V51_16460 [Deltaproteobacteria bacterium]|nr:hypothetical protein [Deltaproteobacteria bacterium]